MLRHNLGVALGRPHLQAEGMGFQPAASSKVGVVGRIFFSLFLSLFLIAGLFFFGLLARSMLQRAKVYRWETVTATIEESRVIPAEHSDHDPAVYVRYHYTYHGRTFTSEHLRADSPPYRDSDAYRIVENLSAGAARPCYVNPANPTESALQRESLWMTLALFFPLIFVGIGGGGIYAVWFGRASDPTKQPVSERAITAKRRPRGAILLFGIFLIAGAATGYFLVIRPILNIIAARGWTAVPCEIVSSRVRSHSDSDGTTYSVDIVYRYRVNGRSYSSNRYNVMIGSSSGYSGKAQVVSSYPAGSKAQCYVDPADPSSAVLDRSVPGGLAFGLIPLAFFVVGVVGVRWSLRAPRDLPISSSRGSFRPSATATPIRATATGSVSMASIEPSGPATLKPQQTRAIKFIGLLIFGVIWNGIISIFVFQVIHGWARGHGSVFETLFLLPFLAVGLGVLAGAVYQALAMRNPQTKLTLDHSPAHLGDTIELSWELTGRIDRLRRLSIELEGREEATYRRGTTTTTDRSVFLRIQIIDTADPSAFSSGRGRVTIPFNSMHSFASANNKIVWTLHVRGEIPRWPDIDDEFSLTVLPLPLSR